MFLTAFFYLYIYIYIYITKSWSVAFIITTLLLSHISSYIIHLFFIFSFHYLNYSSPYFPKKKKKLFFFLLVHTPIVTLLPTFFFIFYFFISLILYCYTFFLFFIYFFLYLNFSSPYFQPKKKTLLLSISSRTYWYTSSNLSLSLLPLYLFTTLPLYFIPLFYILTFLLPNLFCINLISFSHSIHIFLIQNCEYSFSVSLLFFRWIFVLSYNCN